MNEKKTNLKGDASYLSYAAIIPVLTYFHRISQDFDIAYISFLPPDNEMSLSTEECSESTSLPCA